MDSFCVQRLSERIEREECIMPLIGAVADDLTGATTTGVLLARSKARTAVFFNEEAAQKARETASLDAILISSNSRPLPKEEAYEKVKSATNALKAMGVKYFSKRIDTTLRGGVGVEVDAMLDQLNEDTVAVVVPAMPQSRRILVGGYSVIDGVALINTPVAQDVRTPVKEIYNKNNNPKDLEEVIRVLEEGGLIIYPTDTMYAIGCHGLKERAIERICKLKNIDPRKNNLSIICYDLSNISEYAKVDNSTFKLMKRNLPGPFTFILNTGNRLPKIFKNRKEVGIRVPDNNIIREICHILKAPIMTTTLPLKDGEDIEYITTPELIEEKFGKEVELIIDGGIGGIEPSTIVNCTNGEAEIVRQGKGILNDF